MYLITFPIKGNAFTSSFSQIVYDELHDRNHYVYSLALCGCQLFAFKGYAREEKKLFTSSSDSSFKNNLLRAKATYMT